MRAHLRSNRGTAERSPLRETDERGSTGLQLTELTVKRGDLTLCRSVSLEVPRGQITVILGANGSGKSTLLAGVAGLLPTPFGSVHLDGSDITQLPVHSRARQGLAYVEQGRTVFSQLSVQQNLRVPQPPKEALAQAYGLFPRLAKLRNTPAGLLSGGEQQMLVLARAMMGNPHTLMIDELSLGLAPRVLVPLMERLRELAATGVGILLVEQFAHLALQIGDTAHVMHQGRIVRSASCGAFLGRGST